MLTHVYIDGANLDRSARDLGYTIDYERFFGWLKQKYQASEIYYFIGYVQKYNYIYKKLEESGFKLVFKETVTDSRKKIKGNCDAELVLQSIIDFYELIVAQNIIITGDGDFRCLIDFFIERNVKVSILAPDKKRCSSLIKKSPVSITFLENHYHKFSEKAPNADSSA